MHAALCNTAESSAALLRCSRCVNSCHTHRDVVARVYEMTKPYDTALQTIINDKEAQTGEKAPLFGAATYQEAYEGKIWRDIGEAWGGYGRYTAYMAYRARYPAENVRYRYKDETKEEVES